jgi:hypothetical protein
MNDPLGIFNSLIILALIKMSIRDHLLALRDIREAEQLSLINTIINFIELKNELAV